MKYKIRYTAMVVVFCGLLGWDLAYEYQQPAAIALAATSHPVVHSVSLTHLLAPAYTPPAPTPAAPATTTALTSAPTKEATSTAEATSSQSTRHTPQASSTSEKSSSTVSVPPITKPVVTVNRIGL